MRHHAVPPSRHNDPQPSPDHYFDAHLLELRARRLRPVRAVVGWVVALHLLDAVLASEARDFMGTPLVGPLTVGLGFGLLQCATAVGAAYWYAQHARTSLDPLAKHLQVHSMHGEGTR